MWGMYSFWDPLRIRNKRSCWFAINIFMGKVAHIHYAPKELKFEILRTTVLLLLWEITHLTGLLIAFIGGIYGFLEYLGMLNTIEYNETQQSDSFRFDELDCMVRALTPEVAEGADVLRHMASRNEIF
eukprot:Protomagalhaensia_sp_Gyna_25__3934@NODE_353_length_3762_cov_303_129734_g272_i0_p4_GENE_NODE_353_length_3762_cov_303_129734_g272_i0NODE_353_length_3762_cov_303_129734_g272_i0_p4_ORF_typecomplete_len128_score13_59_NODE_353_length_3762_cov_303_129734_g272_i06871070